MVAAQQSRNCTFATREKRGGEERKEKEARVKKRKHRMENVKERAMKIAHLKKR